MRESKRKEANGKVAKKEEKIEVEDELEIIKEEVKETNNDEKKEKNYKDVVKNIIVGCVIIVYFAILLFGKGRIPNMDHIKALKIIIICDLLASLVLLEIGFRKDKFYIGLHGIEMAFVGGFTVYILDMFCKSKENFNIWFSGIISFIAIYYIVKSIIIIRKRRKNIG